MPCFPTFTSLQLDDDVLSVVFHFNTLYDKVHPHRPCATIRATSQVCRQWSPLALSTPTLWAAVLDFVGSEKWIREVVSRSGSIPLTIIIPSLRPSVVGEAQNQSSQSSKDPYMADESSFAHLSLATSLASRSRRFDLTIHTPGQWDSFRHQLPDSLPDLQTFSIKYNHSGTKGTLRLTDLLSHSTPQLCSLALYGRSLDLMSPRFARLRHLEFGDLPPSATPVSWLLHALRAMPLLQYLKMEHVGRKLPLKVLENSADNVTLEHLEFIGLKCPIAWCAALLPKLQVPASCFRSIDIKASHQAVDELESSIDIFQSFLDNPTLPIVEMWVSKSAGSLMCSRSYSTLLDQEPLTVSWQWPNTYCDSMYSCLFSSLSGTISHALELHIAVQDDMAGLTAKSESLTELFQVAVQTEVLTIYGRGSLAPFTVMAALGTENSLPSLKEICFDGCEFGKFMGAGLCGAMKERRRHDLPIDRIQLRECGAVMKEVDMMLKSEFGLETERFDSRSEYEKAGRSAYQTRFKFPRFEYNMFTNLIESSISSMMTSTS